LSRHVKMLIGIVLIAAAAIWVALPGNTGIHASLFGQEINVPISVHEGLDLQGGVQVLLQADVPPGTEVTADSMKAARGIVERRINALGVVEPQIQQGENNRIIVELPGVKDPDQAVKTFGSTGLLEFIDAGSTYLPPDTVVATSLGGPNGSATPTATDGKVYPTIIQGRDLARAYTTFDQFNKPEIGFEMNGDGAKAFGDFTTNNVGKYLAITLDKRVISCPVIESPITAGKGVIQGKFSLAEAKNLVVQLSYGALPIPLKIVQSRTVGPTLGEDSLQRSLVAGAIGLAIVATFMLVYYRLPGLLANFALIIYTAVVFSLFKLIPVTLTLAGVAGFILSIGMAVDANILIFERVKEELRGGRSLRSAIDAGFGRAWTSIRDSNASTLITCAILYWFGMQFGASIIQGFAFTLAIGVVVSMFTAILVSRTFLHLLVESNLVRDLRWFGLHESVPTAPPTVGKPA
jgi:preprotein translocase subunit SecD